MAGDAQERFPNYRDVAEALVHKDLRLSRRQSIRVSARYVREKLVVNADASSVV